MSETSPALPRARRWALYLTIATLIAAALLGAYCIVVGDQASIAARAWMTLLLVALFAGAVALDATVSEGPNRWYLTASTITNVVLVAIGLLKLWNGWLQPSDTSDPFVWAGQLWLFLVVVVLARVALLLTQVYWLYFVTRARSRATKIASVVTLSLIWATTLVLALPAVFPEPEWPDWWWRLAGATSLVAVVSAVIPLIVKAFERRGGDAGRQGYPQQQAYQQPYPGQAYPYPAQPQYPAQQYPAQPQYPTQQQAYPYPPQQPYPAQPYPPQQQPYPAQPYPPQQPQTPPAAPGWTPPAGEQTPPQPPV